MNCEQTWHFRRGWSESWLKRPDTAWAEFDLHYAKLLTLKSLINVKFCAIYMVAPLKFNPLWEIFLIFSSFTPKSFLSTLPEKHAPADYGSTMGNQRSNRTHSTWKVCRFAQIFDVVLAKKVNTHGTSRCF